MTRKFYLLLIIAFAVLVAVVLIGFFGGLTTRDSQFGTVKWSKISASKEMKSGMDDILPHGASGRKIAEEAALAGAAVVMITGSFTMRDQLEGSPFRVRVKPFRLSELAALIRELRSPPA